MPLGEERLAENNRRKNASYTVLENEFFKEQGTPENGLDAPRRDPHATREFYCSDSRWFGKKSRSCAAER
jgi:hypothetical protein